MHKLEFQYNGRFPRNIKKEYPGTWNELTAGQLLYVAELMSMELPKEKFDVLMLKHFFGLKTRHFYKISGAVINEVSETVSFIHTTKELTVNKLPVLKIRKLFKEYKLYGPEDGMLNLTFEQFFGHCEPAFRDYINTRNPFSLDYLVSSLYTFSKDNFDPEDVDRICKFFKRLPIKFKNAVLLFYLGCKDFFAYKWPKLFRVDKSSSNNEISDFHFIELTDQLNNENLSNNEQIKKTKLPEAFVRLTRMIELSEKLKQRQNERSN